MERLSQTTPFKQNPAIARVKKTNNFNTIRNVPKYNKLQYIVIEIFGKCDENYVSLGSYDENYLAKDLEGGL